jgi:hypothetical protein
LVDTSDASNATDVPKSLNSTVPLAATSNSRLFAFAPGKLNNGVHPDGSVSRLSTPSQQAFSRQNAVAEVLTQRQNSALKVQIKELASQADKEIGAAHSEIDRLRKLAAVDRSKLEKLEGQLRKALSTGREDEITRTQGTQRELEAVRGQNETLKRKLRMQHGDFTQQISAYVTRCADHQSCLENAETDIRNLQTQLDLQRSYETSTIAAPPAAPLAPPLPLELPPVSQASPNKVGPFGIQQVTVVGALPYSEETTSWLKRHGVGLIGAPGSTASSLLLCKHAAEVYKARGTRRPPTILTDIGSTQKTQSVPGQSEMLNALVKDLTRHMAGSSKGAAQYLADKKTAKQKG